MVLTASGAGANLALWNSPSVPFPDGTYDCSTFPSDQEGVISADYLGLGGWTGIQYRVCTGRALRLGLHADVEPDRRIESHLLLDEQVGQLVAESVSRRVVGKIAALFAPGDDGVHHAADQLAHRIFALGRVGLAVEILRRHDVGGGLRPALGHFHAFLAEDGLALLVADERHAALPLDSVIRRGAAVGEIPFELEPRADLDIRGLGCARLERRLFVESHFRLCHHRLRAGRFPRAEGTFILLPIAGWERAAV